MPYILKLPKKHKFYDQNDCIKVKNEKLPAWGQMWQLGLGQAIPYHTTVSHPDPVTLLIL